MGRVSFTDRDDCAILEFIISNNFISKVKGNRIWQEMELRGVTSHPWRAMRTRFLRSVIFHIPELLHCTPEGRRRFRSPEAIHDLQRRFKEACSTRTPSPEAALSNSILTSDNSAHGDVEPATECFTPKRNSRSPVNMQQKRTPEKLPILVDYPETQSQSASSIKRRQRRSASLSPSKRRLLRPLESSSHQGDSQNGLSGAVKKPGRQCEITSTKNTELGGASEDAEILGAVSSQENEETDSDSILANKRSLPPSPFHHKGHSPIEETRSHEGQKRSLRPRLTNVDAASASPMASNSEKANRQPSGMSVDLDVESKSNGNKYIRRRALRPRNTSRRQRIIAASDVSMNDVDIQSISDILSTPVDDDQPPRRKTLRARKTLPVKNTNKYQNGDSASVSENTGSLTPRNSSPAKKSMQIDSQTPPIIRQKRYLNYVNLVEKTPPAADQENSLREEDGGVILSGDVIPGTLPETPRGEEAEVTAVQSSNEVDLPFPLMEPCEPSSVAELLSQTVQFTRLLDSFAARHRLTSAEAALLLHATSGDLTTASRLIAHPDESTPLWTPSDDACLLSNYSPVVLSVYKKFGPAEVSRRLQYLSSHTVFS